MGKRESRQEKRGGELEIMRDNESKGGVVPENRKWAGGRGRQKTEECGEKIVERERREGRCFIIYYIIPEHVWHKRRGV